MNGTHVHIRSGFIHSQAQTTLASFFFSLCLNLYSSKAHKHTAVVFLLGVRFQRNLL